MHYPQSLGRLLLRDLLCAESSRPLKLPSSLMGYMPAEVDSHQEEAGAHAIMFKGLGKNLDQSDRWQAGKSREGGTGTWAVKCSLWVWCLGDKSVF